MNTVLFILTYVCIGLGLGIYIQHDYPDIPFYIFVMIAWPVAILVAIILTVIEKIEHFRKED